MSDYRKMILNLLRFSLKRSENKHVPLRGTRVLIARSSHEVHP